MDTGYHCYVVEPKEMDEVRRLALAQKVYAEAHQLVFNGVGFDDFYHCVFTPPTLNTKIMIYAVGDEIIGYATFQLYEINKCGVQLYVAMTEVCLKQHPDEHRAHPTQFFLREITRFLISKPWANIFMVDTLISPKIYKKLSQMAYKVYPNAHEQTPTHLEKVCNIVAKKFKWDFVKKEGCIIRSLSWKLNNIQFSGNFFDDPSKKFYCRLVSDFYMGKGLVIIIPITIFSMAMSIAKAMTHASRYVWLDFKLASKKLLYDWSNQIFGKI